MKFWNRMQSGGRKSFRREELNSTYYLQKKNGFLVPYLDGIQTDQSRIDCLISFFYFFFSYFDRICTDLCFVELFCIGKKSGIAFCFYFVQNFVNCCFKFAIVVWASFQEIFQNIFCTSFVSATVRIMFILLLVIIY